MNSHFALSYFYIFKVAALCICELKSEHDGRTAFRIRAVPGPLVPSFLSSSLEEGDDILP